MIGISLVSLLHLYFMLLEMYFWDKPLGLKTFKMNSEKAATTKALALNQGLYNGFLAAGLIWSLIENNIFLKNQIAIFFLSCVIIAGIVGAITVNKRIFLIQGMPALITLLILFF
jgi:putative membrane protein